MDLNIFKRQSTCSPDALSSGIIVVLVCFSSCVFSCFRIYFLSVLVRSSVFIARSVGQSLLCWTCIGVADMSALISASKVFANRSSFLVACPRISRANEYLLPCREVCGEDEGWWRKDTVQKSPPRQAPSEGESASSTKLPSYIIYSSRLQKQSENEEQKQRDIDIKLGLSAGLRSSVHERPIRRPAIYEEIVRLGIPLRSMVVING